MGVEARRSFVDKNGLLWSQPQLQREVAQAQPRAGMLGCGYGLAEADHNLARRCRLIGDREEENLKSLRRSREGAENRYRRFFTEQVVRVSSSPFVVCVFIYSFELLPLFCFALISLPTWTE